MLTTNGYIRTAEVVLDSLLGMKHIADCCNEIIRKLFHFHVAHSRDINCCIAYNKIKDICQKPTS